MANAARLICYKFFIIKGLTEEVGFEPTDPMKGRRFSKPVH